MDKSGNKFRFAIMGAGFISQRFYQAVNSMETCEVIAVASKSLEKAQKFSAEHDNIAAYDSYEEMLQKEQPDAVYIGTIPSSHYELTMLCLVYKIPVLCEKAMFLNKAEAETVFRRSKEEHIFVMEAMWSRFLPAVCQAKHWLAEGKIGDIKYLEVAIGFPAPKDPENRFYNPKLGGGTRYDILVYAYELATFILEKPIRDVQIHTVWGETGVDITTHVVLKYDDVLASLSTSFETPLKEHMTIYGEHGLIELIQPHMTHAAALYDINRQRVEEYKETETRDGFIYEIQEVIDCVRAGKYESEVVPHQCTLDCAELFDMVEKTREA